MWLSPVNESRFASADTWPRERFFLNCGTSVDEQLHLFIEDELSNT